MKNVVIIDFGRVNLKSLVLTNDKAFYEERKAQGNVGCLLEPSVMNGLGILPGKPIYLVGLE